MCGGGVGDEGVKELMWLTGLRHLSLAQNSRITDKASLFLSGLLQLRDLNLTGTQLTGNGILPLRALTVCPCLWHTYISVSHGILMASDTLWQWWMADKTLKKWDLFSWTNSLHWLGLLYLWSTVTDISSAGLVRECSIVQHVCSMKAPACQRFTRRHDGYAAADAEAGEPVPEEDAGEASGCRPPAAAPTKHPQPQLLTTQLQNTA